MYRKILAAIGICIGMVYAISQADILLNFANINTLSLQDKHSLVHFATPGNNFVGSFLRLPTKSVAPTTITLQTDSKTCTKLVKGLYFNSQRGKRIWPIDNETLQLLQDENPTYEGLTLSGGLYTTCDSGNNYGIFGQITYNRGGITSYLIAGTKMNYADNSMIADMANSLQYFDNKIPIGYLYDSYGGIGFVGGLLSGHQNLINYLNTGGSIQSGFVYSGDMIISNNPGREITISGQNSAMETMRNLIIQGSVGLSKSIEESERTSFLENLNEKTVIYNGSDINSSSVINFAKQKAQSLCKGKEKNPDLGSSTDTILCYENQDLTIDLTSDDYYNKTIIITSGNVFLQGGMNENSLPINLFVDKGIVYLPTTITPTGFTAEGFPGTPSTNSGLYLRGNFIINGLLAGNGLTPFNHKLHLQGKIIMLNTPTRPSAGRQEQITDLLGAGYETTINLQDIFTRTCKLSGTSSDGSSCLGTTATATTPLVILNGNYPSSLLQ